MDLSLSPNELEFRDEVRTWLEENHPGPEPDGGLEEVMEFSEHSGPDHIALVISEVITHLLILAGKYREVVQPEIDEHLFELTIGVNRAI